MAPGLWDPIVPVGAEPPRVESCGVPLDVGVVGGQLGRTQCQSVVRADYRVVVESDGSSGDRARRGPERGEVLPEPRGASVLVHQHVPSVFQAGPPACAPPCVDRVAPP